MRHHNYAYYHEGRPYRLVSVRYYHLGWIINRYELVEPGTGI